MAFKPTANRTTRMYACISMVHSTKDDLSSLMLKLGASGSQTWSFQISEMGIFVETSYAV